VVIWLIKYDQQTAQVARFEGSANTPGDIGCTSLFADGINSADKVDIARAQSDAGGSRISTVMVERRKMNGNASERASRTVRACKCLRNAVGGGGSHKASLESLGDEVKLYLH